MMNNGISRIVEIVGVAGVGKSTLCQALENNDAIHLGDFPDVRKVSNASFFIRNSIQIFPTLFKIPQHNSRKLTRREFVWLSILNGWPDVLKKELKNNRTIILDQGPVYLLAELNKTGPEFLKRQEAEKMWRDVYSRWAGTLDTIVWLDAPDADLLKRIRSRDKEHVIKNESVETTFEFLAGFRKAYERIISNLSANDKNLKILRFDTSQKSPQEIADQLLSEFRSI